MKFSYSAIEKGGKLTNKLWNASRLLLTAGATPGEPRPASVEERWILARLSQAQRAFEGFIGEFDFAHAADELYHVTFDDFCDWYLEAVKQRLYDGDEAARATAFSALEHLLKLLHPVMPHVTEEIWSHLPDRETRLIVGAVARGAATSRTRGRSTASRKRRRCSAARASCRRSRATRSGSSTPS